MILLIPLPQNDHLTLGDSHFLPLKAFKGR